CTQEEKARGRLKGALINIPAAKEKGRGRVGKVVRPEGRLRQVSISILAEKGDARVRVKLVVPPQPRVELVKAQGLINTPEKEIEDGVKRVLPVVVLEPMHYREAIN